MAKKRTMTLEFTEDTYNKVNDLAKSRGVTRAHIIREGIALLDFLQEKVDNSLESPGYGWRNPG